MVAAEDGNDVVERFPIEQGHDDVVITGRGARSPGEIVIGLPANMDGTEGPRARVVRQFAARIGAHTGRQVRFQDERLTSAAADQA